MHGVCMYYNSIEQVWGENIHLSARLKKVELSAHFLMIGNFKNGRRSRRTTIRVEKRKELKVWTKYANHAFLGLLQNQFYSMESCVPGSSVEVRPVNCVSSKINPCPKLAKWNFKNNSYTIT